MAQARRDRGAAQGKPVVYGHVEPAAKAVVRDTAAALKVSEAIAIEVILLSLPLDADGVPTAVDRENFNIEELPIPAH
jgi:hypothetical protein